MPGTHKVDVDVNALVLRAAKARLGKINTQERRTHGVTKTTLADVGRAILANWSPDQEQANPDTDSRGHRLSVGPAKTKHFRFTIAKPLYDRQLKRMRANRTTVTRTLEQGLEDFARTGEYGPQPVETTTT